MKKTLFALIALSFASLGFAGGEACKSSAKCNDKDSKCCCCCCCKGDKDAKACSADKVSGVDKQDAKSAETPARK